MTSQDPSEDFSDRSLIFVPSEQNDLERKTPKKCQKFGILAARTVARRKRVQCNGSETCNPQQPHEGHGKQQARETSCQVEEANGR